MGMAAAPFAKPLGQAPIAHAAERQVGQVPAQVFGLFGQPIGQLHCLRHLRAELVLLGFQALPKAHPLLVSQHPRLRPNLVAKGPQLLADVAEALTGFICEDDQRWRSVTGGSCWNVARVGARLGAVVTASIEKRQWEFYESSSAVTSSRVGA